MALNPDHLSQIQTGQASSPATDSGVGATDGERGGQVDPATRHGTRRQGGLRRAPGPGAVGALIMDPLQRCVGVWLLLPLLLRELDPCGLAVLSVPWSFVVAPSFIHSCCKCTGLWGQLPLFVRTLPEVKDKGMLGALTASHSLFGPIISFISVSVFNQRPL